MFKLRLGLRLEDRVLGLLDGFFLCPVVCSGPLGSLCCFCCFPRIYKILDPGPLGRFGSLIRSHVRHLVRELGNLVGGPVQSRLKSIPE